MNQAENRQLLRKVIKDKIAKNEPEGVLDSWVQPCGTYGCVLGDYVLAKNPDIAGNTSMVNKICNCLDNDFFEEFGFYEWFKSFDQDGDFFRADVVGDSEYGTLQQRLDYVESQILELDGPEALK